MVKCGCRPHTMIKLFASFLLSMMISFLIITQSVDEDTTLLVILSLHFFLQCWYNFHSNLCDKRTYAEIGPFLPGWAWMPALKYGYYLQNKLGTVSVKTKILQSCAVLLYCDNKHTDRNRLIVNPDIGIIRQTWIFMPETKRNVKKKDGLFRWHR